MRELELKNQEIEQKAMELAFKDWFSKLTDEQKIELLPEIFRKNTLTTEKLNKNKALGSSARNYFEKEIWPDKKKEITSGIKELQ